MKTMDCNKKVVFILLAIVNLTFLSGCAHFQKSPPATFKYISWKKREVLQRGITDWKFSGSFSITRHKKRDIARFNWKQKKDSYKTNIFGPMNIGNVEIKGDLDKVRLRDANKRFFGAKTPEELLQQQLGWDMPVSYIRYWILGIPAPTKVDYKYFDRYGHLSFFKQDGWQVKYSEFSCGVREGVDLPKVIELFSNNIAIKIKIKEQKIY